MKISTPIWWTTSNWHWLWFFWRFVKMKKWRVDYQTTAPFTSRLNILLQHCFRHGGHQLLRYFLNLVMLTRPEDMHTNCLNHIATIVLSTLASFKHSVTDVDVTNFSKMRINRHCHCSVIVILSCILFLILFIYLFLIFLCFVYVTCALVKSLLCYLY